MADNERPLLRTVVGRVLRRHRLDQGRTLAEVAREANVSVQYLSEVERGRKEPSSEILAAVCDALHIELSDLLAEVRFDLVGTVAPVLRLAPVAPVPPVSPGSPQQPGRSGSVMLLAA
ncbi:MAG: helix-turn-helix transcriptional regulator [Actinomycetota bacterium]|nr:helix-turn-helix transcriptional regulator [Actinomycetota bacterium]